MMTTITCEQIDSGLLGWQWGQEDATEGKSRRGDQYFIAGSVELAAYNAGYDAGLVLVQILSGSDDGRGSHALGYTLPHEQSDARRQRIIDQVRFASVAERPAALNAAMRYDPHLWQMLAAEYRS